jgi:hypothetical protein
LPNFSGRGSASEAKARIRSLLAMEAHAAEGVLVSRKDVSRVERAILQKKDRHHVFPRLSNLGTEITGDGLQVTVRFSKNKGAPVRLVGADDDVEAAAIREVDLQRKYHFSPAELAKHLNLSPPRTVALRRFLRIDEDPACRHDFVFGSQTHRGYSDNAVVKMRAAMTEVDMDEVWRTHGPRRRAAGALSETA